MDFLDVVTQRRAVREYAPTAIERSRIARLIGIAVQAPSAMNLQPWAFVVATGVARLDAYARRAREHLLSTAMLPTGARRILDAPGYSMFHHAPLLLIVLATTPDPQAREDCCLAAQTFMLAARNDGLGTCWIGFARPWLEVRETKAELGIPDSYGVVAPIVLGHPAAWPAPHGRREPQIRWVESPALEAAHIMEERS